MGRDWGWGLGCPHAAIAGVGGHRIERVTVSLSATEISALLRGWSELVGARVRKVRAVRDEPAVVIELRSQGNNVSILIAATEGATRLHKVVERPASPAHPGSFAMLLRKYIIGASLDAVAQVSGDRIVRLVFSKGEHQLHLVAELSGRHGNVFALGEGDEVLASLVRNKSSLRPLSPGRTWTAPPMAKSAGALRSDWPAGDVDAFVDDLYRARVADVRLTTMRREAARPHRKALKKAERAIRSVGRDLEKIAGAESLREEADLLQQAWGKAGRGDTSITVTDWESGAEREIRLDPTKDLNENIHARYHRYRRLKRGREVATKRLQDLQQEADDARSLIAQVERADADALSTILADRPRSQTGGAKRNVPVERRPYHEFVASDGTPILVGRGSKDNDTLTFRVARGNDMWLHAADWAGSHVVIRSGRTLPSRRTLEEAAMLAAHYSKGREDGVITVNYTQRKHVKKPKGAAPGRVSIAGTKSIDVRMEPEKLKRLFATRR